MMTCSACFIRNAASSDEPRFHGRSVAAAAAPPAPLSAPKPPAITQMKLRFIALHMMSERIAPDAPTSAPAMIIALFCGVTPKAAAPPTDKPVRNTTTPHTPDPTVGPHN